MKVILERSWYPLISQHNISSLDFVQAERTIHTLEDMLISYVIDFKGSWDDHLLQKVFAYNNSYH